MKWNEILASVMCVKEYRRNLFDGVIIVFIDHRSLAYRTRRPQRVIRWRMYDEDFDITFKYIKG